jgi:cell division protein FtsL
MPGSHDHVAYVQHQTYVLNISIKKLEEKIRPKDNKKWTNSLQVEGI